MGEADGSDSQDYRASFLSLIFSSAAPPETVMLSEQSRTSYDEKVQTNCRGTADAGFRPPEKGAT